MSIDGALATRPKVGCDVALFSSDLLPSSEIWAADKGRIFPMSLPSTSIESEAERDLPAADGTCPGFLFSDYDAPTQSSDQRRLLSTRP